MFEDRGVTAPGVLQCVAQDGESLEIALLVHLKS
jgi:hypothetical protein